MGIQTKATHEKGKNVMPAVTRKGDADVAHCSGMVREGHFADIEINGIPVSCQGHNNTGHLLPGAPCPVHAAPIAVGSTTVFCHGKGIGRIGDATCTAVAAGSPDIFAGP